MQSLFRNSWQDSLSKDADCSETFRRWIADKASLTANVKQLCEGQFSVRVLKHDLTTTPAFAAEELGVPVGSELLHREVLLCDDDTPLVFACSLLPGAALTGRFAEIRTLGARPLGHWIFSEPVLHRQSMQFAWIPADARLFDRLPDIGAQTATLPGRKTVFTGAAFPFIVSEFFLPALQKKIQPTE